MEYQRIKNLLGNTSDQVPRYVTKKWIEVYDESGGTYSVNKEIKFKTPMLRSDLCDYNEAYIVVTGKVTVTNPNNNAYDKKLALKNNAPFFSRLEQNATIFFIIKKDEETVLNFSQNSVDVS